MTSTEPAPFAEADSEQIDTQQKKPAQPFVLGVRSLSRARPVYNFTVEGEPEYFANGILVHNCDNLRYLAMHGCRYIKPKPPPKRESYAVAAVRKKKEAARKEKGQNYVSLAPGM